MGCCALGADQMTPGWQRWDDHPARQQWDVVKDLGQGAFAEVVLARNKKSGELAALKVVFLQSPSVDGEHCAIMQRESEFLCMLDHPNIVECRDVFRSPKQIVLVLEWLRGGHVIDKLFQLGPQYSEQQAADIFVQLAEGVACLHEYSILHRDIKPENIMFAAPPQPQAISVADLQNGKRAPGPVVKLVDLGMACTYDPTNPVKGPLGSAGFVAPDIVKGGEHTPAMDVFSLGVLLFVMLVGRKPFNIKESENLQYAFLTLHDAPGLHDPRWLDLSPDAKHLLMGMLGYDAKRRLTMQQVLQHEWVVSRGGRLPRPLGQDVVLGAATVASVRRLRNLCGGAVALSRTAAATATGKPPGRGAGKAATDASLADSAREAYMRRLQQSQRHENSVRGGGALNSVARGLASRSYARLHDRGQVALDPTADVSMHPSQRGSQESSVANGSRRSGFLYRLSSRPAAAPARGRSSAALGQQDASSSAQSRLQGQVQGMRKSGTTVMLSEMASGQGANRSADPSTRGMRRTLTLSAFSPVTSSSTPTGGAEGASPSSPNNSAAGAAAAGGAAVAGGSPTLGQHTASGVQRPPPPSTVQLLGLAARTFAEGRGSRRGSRASLQDPSLTGRVRSHQGTAHGADLALASDAALALHGSGAGASAAPPPIAEGGASPSAASRAAGAEAGSAAAAAAASLGSHALLPPPQPAAGAAAAGAAPSSSSGSLLGSLGGSVELPAGLPAGPVVVAKRAPPTMNGHPLSAPPLPARGSALSVSDSDRSTSSRAGNYFYYDGIDGLRAPRTVRRQSMENPLTSRSGNSQAEANGGRSWAEMQVVLAKQSRSANQSRDGTRSSTGGGKSRVIRVPTFQE